MFVKNAISWFGQRLFGAKDPNFTRQLLMPLLFLASVSLQMNLVKGLPHSLHGGIEIVRGASGNQGQSGQAPPDPGTRPRRNSHLLERSESARWSH